MRCFGLLPSSPDIKAMNDSQWMFCYLNIVKDEEEKEEMWKARAKYLGMFINPSAVAEMSKIENGENDGSSEKYSKIENQYINDDFERELMNILKDEQLIELPESSDIRGNANMSSDDFISMCLENYNEINNEQDLDIIEID